MTAQVIGAATSFPRDVAGPRCTVANVSRAELARTRHWTSAFAGKRKDHRYYELLEDTLAQGFEHRYFVIRGAHGEVRAVQPFIVLDQDLLTGLGSRSHGLVGR